MKLFKIICLLFFTLPVHSYGESQVFQAIESQKVNHPQATQVTQNLSPAPVEHYDKKFYGGLKKIVAAFIFLATISVSVLALILKGR